jgi:uncharacterized protein YndB with AHSA1/START domain
METQAETIERIVELRRLIDAPVAMVWAAWTDPKELMQWWGPHQFTAPECTVDLRVGGRIYMIMKGPQGPGFPWDGQFLEIVENERLVFTNRPLGADGAPLAEGLTTVTFKAVGAKTELAIHSVVTTNIKPMIEGMDEGWRQQTEKMVAYLERR